MVPQSYSDREANRDSGHRSSVVTRTYLRMMGMPRRWSDDDLISAIRSSRSLRQAVQRLGLKPRGSKEILVAGSRYSTDNLKQRLIREGLLALHCAKCTRNTWNGRAIPLELHHINGRRDDHRIENLQRLCPNCQAQTPTYRGKNIGRTEPPYPNRQREGA